MDGWILLRKLVLLEHLAMLINQKIIYDGTDDDNNNCNDAGGTFFLKWDLWGRICEMTNLIVIR